MSGETRLRVPSRSHWGWGEVAWARRGAGGVANNESAVNELRKLVRENYGDVHINISPDSIYTGALGGASFARRAVAA